MWGWGSVIADEFNLDKISVENCAMAGRSARTFLDEDVGIKYTKLCSPVILYSFSSDTTTQELSIQEKPVQNYVVPERKVKSF